MTGSAEWKGRVGKAWAELADQTDRSFGPVTDAILASIAGRGFRHALDIGCGAGELACRLAASVVTQDVTGIDISEDLVTAARARCPAVRFEVADAATYRPDPPPDLLVSRHGVMFFPDPVAAFAALMEAAAPGAKLRFSCFRARRDNRWASALGEAVGAIPPPVGDRSPGPFAFAEEAYVTDILRSSGWVRAVVTKLDYAMVAGVGTHEEAVSEAVAYFRRIGPAAGPLRMLESAARTSALGKIEALLDSHYENGQVALPAAAWIVTARAPG